MAYEAIILLNPQLSDDEVGSFLDKTKKIIVKEGGEVLTEDRWGRRKLTYPIRQAREGSYAYIKFQGSPSVLNRLSYHFKVTDSILRTMVVKAREKKSAMGRKETAGAKK
ncbi:MAG: 30S ribosomal protein S6 [Elusimicrobia bacterium]|nr:30S ribosomal protein S6 [Elusimicrobiota bacterium]